MTKIISFEQSKKHIEKIDREDFLRKLIENSPQGRQLRKGTRVDFSNVHNNDTCLETSMLKM